jgi:hypothetical protein
VFVERPGHALDWFDHVRANLTTFFSSARILRGVNFMPMPAYISFILAILFIVGLCLTTAITSGTVGTRPTVIAQIA